MAKTVTATKGNTAGKKAVKKNDPKKAVAKKPAAGRTSAGSKKTGSSLLEKKNGTVRKSTAEGSVAPTRVGTAKSAARTSAAARGSVGTGVATSNASARAGFRFAPATGQDLSAKAFVEVLMTFQSDAELKKYERYFKFSDEKPLVGDQFAGVRMGHVFNVAKLFVDMPVGEIEKLMESPIHEVRAGAMSIMGKSASAKRVPESRLKELYELYLRRHDRINSRDLVDLAAHQVVGHYLNDKPRTILYTLAKSKNPFERRTAILATAHFIRQGEVGETFRIAALLMKDVDETVNKASGWMLRYAGKDRKQLKQFLDQYAATMPRSALRNALEHFDSKEKNYYMGLKKG